MKLLAKSLKIVEDLDFKKDRYEIANIYHVNQNYITVDLNYDLGLQNELAEQTIRTFLEEYMFLYFF